MVLLHPTTEIVTKPAVLQATIRESLGLAPASCSKLKQEDSLVTYTPNDVLQNAGTDLAGRAPYLANVVRCQASVRMQRKRSALLWGSFGGIAGLLVGAPTGPFCPLFIAGGAATGAAMGAAAPIETAASFKQVRKHLFFKSGIVANRHESAVLVAALKKAKIIDQGRDRSILNLKDLDGFLAKQAYLSTQQADKVRECLTLIAKQASHFDALIKERAQLENQISYARRAHRGASNGSPNLQALYARRAEIQAQLQLKPEAAPASKAPLAVADKALPKAIVGPQHMQLPTTV